MTEQLFTGKLNQNQPPPPTKKNNNKKQKNPTLVYLTLQKSYPTHPPYPTLQVESQSTSSPGPYLTPTLPWNLTIILDDVKS